MALTLPYDWVAADGTPVGTGTLGRVALLLPPGANPAELVGLCAGVEVVRARVLPPCTQTPMTLRRPRPATNRFGRPRRRAALRARNARAAPPRRPSCYVQPKQISTRSLGARTAHYTPVPANYALYDRET